MAAQTAQVRKPSKVEPKVTAKTEKKNPVMVAAGHKAWETRNKNLKAKAKVQKKKPAKEKQFFSNNKSRVSKTV